MNTLTPEIKVEIVDTYDIRVIRVSDESNWKHLINETTYIKVTTPGRTKEILNYFQKDKVNLLNSNNLELTLNGDKLVALPDGIYNINVFVDGDNNFCHSFSYLRTVNFMLEVDKLLIDMDLCSCSEENTSIKLYSKIELLMKSAHANIRSGNIDQALCEFEKAKELKEEISGCGK